MPAAAQTVLSGDHSVDGNLCVGIACTGSETFGLATQKLKEGSPILRFEDTSTGTNNPTRDWELHANAFIGTGEYFGIFDVGTSQMVFQIEADAPSHSLFVDESGDVGMGTSLPTTSLHIVSPGNPTIRLEPALTSSRHWDIVNSSGFFFFLDGTTSTSPFAIQIGAPSSSFRIAADGNVGIGTPGPTAPFELSGDKSFNFFRITATGAAINESVDITFTGGPLGTGQLRYNIVDGDTQEMSLDADGNMILDGTLTTSGPTCAGGCDRVFDADYPLPSIEAHATAMFTNKYLPSVGPTRPGVPVNMTERQAAMLNALEHAHIYIAELEENDRLHEAHLIVQNQRITQLEAMIGKLASP